MIYLTPGTAVFMNLRGTVVGRLKSGILDFDSLETDATIYSVMRYLNFTELVPSIRQGILYQIIQSLIDEGFIRVREYEGPPANSQYIIIVARRREYEVDDR